MFGGAVVLDDVVDQSCRRRGDERSGGFIQCLRVERAAGRGRDQPEQPKSHPRLRYLPALNVSRADRGLDRGLDKA